ncbi:MAG: hypothetical protein C3F17_05040 [Bradyrhizobiaceae bacterium]|nr:MAG: hypothetical protein C3F17_05040 [Bradyrhizobiaceae bacterium]
MLEPVDAIDPVDGLDTRHREADAARTSAAASALYRSRYTLAESWGDGRGILLNSFTGAVDIVSERVARYVKESRQADLDPSDPLYATLVDRGYYVESREIEDACARLWARKSKEEAVAYEHAKYMFGLTLKCNLTCKYCWQVIEHGNARQKTNLMSAEVVDAAFRFIDRDMRERGKKGATVSLFGGEPLIDKPQFHALVQAIGERTRERGFQLHFTSNGRELGAFKAEVARYAPSIQVTVDGAEFPEAGPLLTRAGQKLHGLFDVLADVAQMRSGGIFLRFLVNTGTVESFVRLADRIFSDPRFAHGFTLAVAPLQNKTGEIDDGIPPKFRVLSALMEALKDRPYAPRISYIDWRSLFLFNGLRAGEEMLPMPVFYHCEANVDLTCFDQDGLIYTCYETIGDPKFSVGRFWPEISVDEAHLAQYRGRSAFSMPQCSECAVSPICGGGCEVRGHKKSGAYMNPFCDDLHAETSLVLRNWGAIARMLTGRSHVPDA